MARLFRAQQSRAGRVLSSNELRASESEVVNEKKHREPDMKPPVLGKCGNDADNARPDHDRGINGALGAKMFPTLQGGVDQIDRKEQRKEEKYFAIVIEKINLPIIDRLSPSGAGNRSAAIK